MGFGGGGLGLGGGGGMSPDLMNIYRTLGAQGFAKPQIRKFPPELQQQLDGGGMQHLDGGGLQGGGGVQNIDGGGLQSGGNAGGQPFQAKPAIGRQVPPAVGRQVSPAVSGASPGQAGGADPGAASGGNAGGGGVQSLRMPMTSMPISIAQSPISSALLSSIGAGGGASPAGSPTDTIHSFAPNVFHPEAPAPNVYHPTAPGSPPIMAEKPLRMGNPPMAIDSYSVPGQKDDGGGMQAKPLVKPLPMPAAGGGMQVKPLKQPTQPIARQPEQVKPEIAAKLAKKLKPGSQATGGVAQTPDIINQSPILQKMALAMQRGPERY
jgi:hypothetical protein